MTPQQVRWRERLAEIRALVDASGRFRFVAGPCAECQCEQVLAVPQGQIARCIACEEPLE